MCAPAIIPIISAIGAIGTAGQALGIFGNKKHNQNLGRTATAQPTLKGPSPLATGAGDDEKVKKEEEVKVAQSTSQLLNKKRTGEGTDALGANKAVNTGIDNTPAGGINV